ncbi:MAG: ATP-binding protein, partial [Okeania sp. SIO2C9]|uniref:sensor histidine kinase n=1 Tax=Okeania sp. SIO2C9 TaxID=2607791 RepID=UPI0013BF3FCD
IALKDVERLRQLIQDFLTLSRLEHGQVYHRPESLELQQALDLVLSGLTNNPEQKQLPQIKVELPSQLPPIRADGDKLVEVLTKLIDNACKFTAASGEVTIQALLYDFNVETTQADVPSPMLEVIIADTGRGIAPSQLEAIFSYFYQEEDALRRTAGGTGIGLAICRQIIQGIGGKIWATSAGKKQGSRFHFTIPIVLEK